MAKLTIRKSQEDAAKIVEFMQKDECIGFNKNPLRMKDFEATPTKMDDIRTEVQDPLEKLI